MQLESAVSAATTAERLADSRYRGGIVAYGEVLIARGRRLQLEKQMIEMRGALARDTVALFKALGGGWPELADAGAQQ